MIGTMGRQRTIFGAVLWLVIIGITAWGAYRATRKAGGLEETVGRVSRYFLNRPVRVYVTFPSIGILRPGHTIYRQDPKSDRFPIGRVIELDAQEGPNTRVLAEIDPAAARQLTVLARFELVEPSGSAAWVLSTLLTPERVAEMRQKWESALARYKSRMVAELQPILEGFARDGLELLNEELPLVFEGRRSEWKALLQVYRVEIIDREILPLLSTVVLPAIVAEGRPVIEKVGQELWKDFPLWGIGWRYALDSLPGTKPDRVTKAWELYVKEKAIPTIQAHAPQLIAAGEKIVREITSDEKFQAGIQRSLKTLFRDPRFETFASHLIDDLTVKNPRVRRFITDSLEDERLKNAFRRIANRLQPTINNSLNVLFLDATGKKINPDFAKVIRNQFLGKDQVWILVRQIEGGDPVRSGDSFVGKRFVP